MNNLRMNSNNRIKKISFRQKKATTCPICSHEFHREEMLTGGGRLIAGNITDELRRLYEKNEKYGKVYPLSYLVSVCPNCLYASYPKDFDKITTDDIESLRNSSQTRLESINKYFNNIDFDKNRDLQLGAASYLLAVECYSDRNKNVAPTFKIAISSIRAAWLLGDLYEETNNILYKKISDFFYRKAYKSYHLSLKLVQTGGELMEDVGNLGPDYDKNWGYDGIMYMCAILTVKIGSKEIDLKKRINNFEVTKRYLSRLFGDGKSSKARPGAIVEMIRELYQTINEMLDKWYQELVEIEETN
ncbi:MAG: DUF2225 domain-containing protein [Spirochaetota bacterium]|nr:DUF2225 domain-containing protein [Spirochaetota bacterium]